MKLNMKLPNCFTKSRLSSVAIIAATNWLANVSLLALINLLMVSTCSLAHYQQPHQQEPVATNEIPTSALEHDYQTKNFSQYSRDVTNLRLLPELRSIKLRWTYEHGDVNRPESFKIRYCELTSWMAEIKCRHKDIQVVRPADVKQLKQQQHERQSEAPANFSHPSLPFALDGGAVDAPALNSTTVIKQQQQQEALKEVNQAASGNSTTTGAGLVSQTFETQIYDLRALTNYTFYVNVLRFVGEQDLASESLSLAIKAVAPAESAHSGNSRRHQRPSRRLDLVQSQYGGNELTGAATSSAAGQFAKLGAMIETTKPFSAEAVKCMAGSSEVLVNTGRYFGGRISVEGQPDSRCQLLGNKSSEQPVYSFHIDHQICHGKIMNGDRIETMILVHENKDILTHNTARFLVVCNIAQKSFTVKASVSLPKVMNSLNQQQAHLSQRSRPATIIPLSARPLSSATPFSDNTGANYDRVRLGSMPGIYRLTRADGSSSTAPTFLASTLPPPPLPARKLPTSTAPSSIHTTTTTTTTVAVAAATVNETATPTIEAGKNGSSGSEAIMNLPTNSTFNQQQQQQQQQLSHMESQVSAPTIADASALALLSSGGQSVRQSKELSISSSDATATTIGDHANGNNNLMRSMDFPSVLASNSVARQQQWQPQSDKLLSLPLPKPIEVSSKILFVERAATGDPPMLPSSAMTASITPVSQREARLFHANSGLVSQYPQHSQFPPPRLSDRPKHQSYEQAVARTASQSPSRPHHLDRQQSAAMVRGGEGTTDERRSVELTLPPITTAASTKDSDEESAVPIIMTNNHRIADDYLALSQVPTAAPSSVRQVNETSSESIEPLDFSIKYSANKVDDYSLGRLGSTSTLAPATLGDRERSYGRSLPLPPSLFTAQPTSSQTTTTSQMPRSRSGRMRQIAASDQANVIERQVMPNGVDFESRMGDAMQVAAADLIAGDASNRSEQVVRASSGDVTRVSQLTNGTVAQSPQPPQQHSLAHNITGALIRWSLKQLGSLARKSLESLVVDERSGPESMASFTPSDHSSLAGRKLPTQRQGVGESEAAHYESHLDGFLINRITGHSQPPPTPLATTTKPSRASLQPEEAPRNVSRLAARQQHLNKNSTPPPIEPPPAIATVATTTTTPPPILPNGRVRHKSRLREASNGQNQADTITQLDRAGSEQRHSKAEEPEVRALWPIYALLALICFIAAIMVTLYFALSPENCGRHQARLASLYRKPSASSHQQYTSGKAMFARINETFNKNRRHRHDPCQQNGLHPSAVSGNHTNCQVNFVGPIRSNSVGINDGSGDKQTGRQLFDADTKDKGIGSFVNNRGQAIMTKDQRIFKTVAAAEAGTHLASQKSPSPSGGSATTRSTSVASTTSSVGGENFCKNQEQFVVYSDYLLLEDDKSSLAAGLDACIPAKLHGISCSPSESFA